GRRRTLRLPTTRRHRRGCSAPRAAAVVVIPRWNRSRSRNRIGQPGHTTGRNRCARSARPRTEPVGGVRYHRARPGVDHRDRTVRGAPVWIPTPETVPAIAPEVPRVVPGIVPAPTIADRDRHAAGRIAPATREARIRVVPIGIVAATGDNHRLLALVTRTPDPVADHVVAELAVASHLPGDRQQLCLGVATQILQPEPVIVPVHPGRELAEVDRIARENR